MIIQKNIHSYIHILCWIHENLTQKRGWKTASRRWVLKHIQVCFYTEHYAFGKHRVWNNTPVHVLAFPVMLPNQQTQPTATITRNKSLAWKGAGSPFGLEPDNSRSQKCKWAGLLCFTEPQVPPWKQRQNIFWPMANHYHTPRRKDINGSTLLNSISF